MRYTRCLLTTPDGQQSFDGIDKDEDAEVAKANAYAKAQEVMGENVPDLEDMTTSITNHVTSGEIGQ